MNYNENTRTIDLKVEELEDIIEKATTRALAKISGADTGGESSRWIVGYDEIQKVLHCKRTKASEIVNSGAFRDAVGFIGQTPVIDMVKLHKKLPRK